MANTKLKRNPHSNHINKSSISTFSKQWGTEETMWKGVVLQITTKTKIILIFLRREEFLNNKILINNLNNLLVKESVKALAY